jgi:hypothetical protein
MRISISAFVFFLFVFGSCKNSAVEKNPMLGSIYRDKDEVAGLKELEEKNSSVLQNHKDKNGEFEFAIALFQKGKRNVVLFEQLVREELSDRSGIR